MRSVLGLVIARAKGLVALSARIVGTCLVIVLPGLAVGGVVIWWLLSEHDINFYLTTKPREFWVAVGVIGMVLLILALMLVYRLSGWVYAMPILVFEESDAKHALAESTRRVRGNRVRLAAPIGRDDVARRAEGDQRIGHRVRAARGQVEVR